MVEIGKKYLVTTEEWFAGPDGERYKAVHGTVTGLHSDDATLGIKTNRGHTNWYMEIGQMIIAGCQIKYAIRTDEVNKEPVLEQNWHDGKIVGGFAKSSIFITE